MNTKLFFILISLFFFTTLRGELIYSNPFSSQDSLKGWQVRPEASTSGGVLSFDLKKQTGGFPCIYRSLPPEKAAGKLIAISAEIKGSQLKRYQKKPFTGVKLQFLATADGKNIFAGPTLTKEGSYDWQTLRQVLYLPPNVQDLKLQIGMQGTTGSFQLKNLKIEDLGTPLPFHRAANMAYRDEKAGDGIGGWSDQGPQNDGSPFLQELWRKEYRGFPFQIQRQGKSVLTLGSRKFPAGPKGITVPLHAPVNAKYLYLLHTLCWGADRKNTVIGQIEVTGTKGKELIPIAIGKQVGDWWSSSRLTSGFPALTVRIPRNGTRTLYASRLELKQNLGEITALRFLSANRESIWILCAATLSNEKINDPEDKPALEIKAGKEWMPFPRNDYDFCIPGSPMDLSRFEKWPESGSLGRMVVSERGTLCFEREPERDLQMLCGLFPMTFYRVLEAEQCVNEFVRRGLRMARFHFLDIFLMSGSSRDVEFNTRSLDIFDYTVAEMKKRGMYLMLDLMTHPNGYYAQTRFDKWSNLQNSHNMKLQIHFSEEARQNWVAGVKKLLTHVNPYTKKTLIDDPVLAMVITFNEQTFAFSSFMNTKIVTPHFHKYLERKYKTIDAYNKARGKKYRSFAEIPCFRNFNDKDTDVLNFILETEQNTMDWYRRELRNMGYKGLIAGCNLSKRHTGNVIRLKNDIVAINSYHDHPQNGFSKGALVRQTSAVDNAAGLFRDLISAKLTGKPLVVSEYSHVFWNRYRHQQPFVVGAYAALNGISVLALHGGVVHVEALTRGAERFGIRPFSSQRDPVAQASEFLTYFLFVRGDVEPAENEVRIRVTEKDWRSLTGQQVFSRSQNALALLMRFSANYGQTITGKIRKGIELPLAGGSETVETNATLQSSESAFSDASVYVKLLKQKGLLPSDNRTDGKSIFESANKQIYMDCNRNLVRINTPRFQGICAPAGTKEKMDDFEVLALGRDASLSLVSLDGKQPIRSAGTLMLVFATNALNSNMKFYDKDMRKLFHPGYYPPLLQNGSFRVAIRNDRAERLKLHCLHYSGKRMKTILPETVEAGRAVFSIDTARDGAFLFFELSAE